MLFLDFDRIFLATVVLKIFDTMLQWRRFVSYHFCALNLAVLIIYLFVEQSLRLLSIVHFDGIFDAMLQWRRFV